MEFYWNDETIEYFVNRDKPGCEGQYYREVEEFVKQNCTLEEGETYFMLRDDLFEQVKKAKNETNRSK